MVTIVPALAGSIRPMCNRIFQVEIGSPALASLYLLRGSITTTTIRQIIPGWVMPQEVLLLYNW